MVDWNVLKDVKGLDPKTPAEFLEVIRRSTEIFQGVWDDIEDGDGEQTHMGEEGKPITKTDYFVLVQSCSSMALENLADFNLWRKRK